MKFRHSIGLFPNENKTDSFFSWTMKEVLAIKLELPCGFLKLWNAYKHSPCFSRVTAVTTALPKLERSCILQKGISPARASSHRNMRKTELSQTDFLSSSPLVQKLASISKSLIAFSTRTGSSWSKTSAAEGLPKPEKVLCLLWVYFCMKIPVSFIAWDVFFLVSLLEMTESCPLKSGGKSLVMIFQTFNHVILLACFSFRSLSKQA